MNTNALICTKQMLMLKLLQKVFITSGVLEHKWRASLKTILFLLTSNTEATENKVKFLNLAYRVKGFQCHSNNSLQLLELKEKTTTTKQYVIYKFSL